jgi:ribosomal protein S18 acetylase RimI-like enzyme
LHEATRIDKPGRVTANSSPTRLVLRRATPSDLHYVLDLAKTTFADFGDYEEIVRHWLGVAGTVSIVALEGEERRGFAVVARRRPVGFRRRCAAELIAIAVSEEARSRGLGRSLLERAELIARTWDAEEMRLHTATTNVVAQRLFRSVGYRPLDTAPSRYPNGQEALEMARALR